MKKYAILMKKYAILVAVAMMAAVGLGDNIRAAKAAHRLTDEQLFDVISKAPSGSSVTVPADFFRDMIAGKYRWQNATNWIAEASGDDTMITALQKMDDDRRMAVETRIAVSNALSRTITTLRARLESQKCDFDNKWNYETNLIAQVRKSYKKAVDDLIGTRAREKDAVKKFYEFRDLYQQYFDKFNDLDAKWNSARQDIIAKRKEVQQKYDEATFITKSIYKFFLDMIDAILGDFTAESMTEDEVNHAVDTVIETE